MQVIVCSVPLFLLLLLSWLFSLSCKACPRCWHSFYFHPFSECNICLSLGSFVKLFHLKVDGLAFILIPESSQVQSSESLWFLGLSCYHSMSLLLCMVFKCHPGRIDDITMLPVSFLYILINMMWYLFVPPPVMLYRYFCYCHDVHRLLLLLLLLFLLLCYGQQ